MFKRGQMNAKDNVYLWYRKNQNLEKSSKNRQGPRFTIDYLSEETEVHVSVFWVRICNSDELFAFLSIIKNLFAWFWPYKMRLNEIMIIVSHSVREIVHQVFVFSLKTPSQHWYLGF